MTTDAQRLARAQELALNILLLWRARYESAALPSLWPYMPSDFYYAAAPLLGEVSECGCRLSGLMNTMYLYALEDKLVVYRYDEKEGCWKKN